MRSDTATAAILAPLAWIASFPGNAAAQSVSPQVIPSSSISFEGCDPAKQRYADYVGVPCSALRAIQPSPMPAFMPAPAMAADPPVRRASGRDVEVPPPSTPGSAYPGPVASLDGRRPSLATPTAPAAAMDRPGATMQGLPVAYVQHARPPILAYHRSSTNVAVGAVVSFVALPAAAVIGGLAGVAAVNAGRDVVSRYGIRDPSDGMAREIAQAYAAARGGHVLEAPLADDDLPIRALGHAAGDSSKSTGYVVDVASPNMNVFSFVLDMSRYDVSYASSVRIIDAANGKVVAKAKCRLDIKKTADAPTHPEMLANEAARLKQIIADKSQACVARMKTSLAI